MPSSRDGKRAAETLGQPTLPAPPATENVSTWPLVSDDCLVDEQLRLDYGGHSDCNPSRRKLGVHFSGD